MWLPELELSPLLGEVETFLTSGVDTKWVIEQKIQIAIAERLEILIDIGNALDKRRLREI